MESVGIHQRKFKVTDKKKRRRKTAGARYLIPHGILIILTVVSLLHFIRGKYGMALIYSSVIIFWLGHNLTALLYAVLFMMGRESRRISDRIGAVEKAEAAVGDRTWSGETVDVSEEGIALRVTDPRVDENGKEFRIKKGEKFSISVTAKYYRALLNAVCAYSRREQSGEWFVTASVSPGDETDRRNWLQIIHDREHSLPREIDPWMTLYDEVSRNVQRRWGKRKER